MNILVFGGSGFIGSDFIKRYSGRFGHIYVLSHSRILEDAPNVSIVTRSDLHGLKKLALVLHCAFDHNYRENLSMAKLAHQICEKNSCPLIYLSTFMVRDLTDGQLSSIKPAKIYDPYTLEKLRVKNFLVNAFQLSSLPLIQIEPGIVYGKNGGWFQHANEMIEQKQIMLPNFGRNTAPFIYVGELSSFIFSKAYKIINLSENICVSGKIIKTWSDFYLLHASLKNYYVEIKNSPSRKLHSSYFIHSLMHLVINTKVGKLLFFITPLLKGIFKKNAGSAHNKGKSGEKHATKSTLRSYGITYMLQCINFNIDKNHQGVEILGQNSFSMSSLLKEMRCGK